MLKSEQKYDILDYYAILAHYNGSIEKLPFFEILQINKHLN